MSRHDCAGATLPELLVGLVISLLVVMTAVAGTVRYQRASATVEVWMNARGQLRDAADILAADLRGISVPGDSLLATADTAVEFRSALGSSFVCSIPSANRIVLPPDSLPAERVLSSWVMPPDSGDMLLTYVAAGDSSPGQWARRRINAFVPIRASLGCPQAAGMLDVAEIAGAGSAYDVTLDGPILEVQRGAPVRILRRVRYSVYRGGDGHWYVGYRRCTTGCAATQPISGPYDVPRGYPLSLRYFDRSGATLSINGPTTNPASVEVTVRTAYQRPLWFPGMAVRTDDSTRSLIALRNAR